MVFSWDDWNLDHVDTHDVNPAEVEYVVKHALPPFPREIGEDKQKVWGRTSEGRYLQVIFVYRSDDQIDYEALSLADLLAVEAGEGPVVYVIHAMDLTPNMKRQYRKLME